MSSRRAGSPSLLHNSNVPTRAHPMPINEPEVIDISDSEDCQDTKPQVEKKPSIKAERVKEEDLSDDDIEYLGYNEKPKPQHVQHSSLESGLHQTEKTSPAPLGPTSSSSSSEVDASTSAPSNNSNWGNDEIPEPSEPTVVTQQKQTAEIGTDPMDQIQNESISMPVNPPVPLNPRIIPVNNPSDPPRLNNPSALGTEKAPLFVPFMLNFTFNVDGTHKVQVTANPEKPRVVDPQGISTSCDRETIVNGEVVRRTSYNVTLPAPTENQNVEDIEEQMRQIFESQHSSDKPENSRKRKVFEPSSSQVSSDRTSSVGIHCAHQSKDKDEEVEKEKRQAQYKKIQERRHSAKDRSTSDTPPAFKTEEDLILLISGCKKCNRTFRTRREGVDHQKNEHNKKYCPVCFQSRSCRGNDWKDHLMKRHSIKSKEMAKCPFCPNEFSFDGMYQHIGRVHLVKTESQMIRFRSSNKAQCSTQPGVQIFKVPASKASSSKSKIPHTSRPAPPQDELTPPPKPKKHKSDTPAGTGGKHDGSKTTSALNSQAPSSSKSSSTKPSSFSTRESESLTTRQIHLLKKYYEQNQLPTREELEVIALKIGASYKKVEIWFNETHFGPGNSSSKSSTSTKK